MTKEETPTLCELLSKDDNNNFFWYASGEGKKLTEGDYNDKRRI